MKKNKLLLILLGFVLSGCGSTSSLSSLESNSSENQISSIESSINDSASSVFTSSSSSEISSTQSSTSEKSSIDKYSLTLNLANGVTITALESEYEAGSQVSFSITSSLEKGTYYVVSINQEILSPVDGVYSFLMPAENVTLSIDIESIDYNINVVPNENVDITLVSNSDNIAHYQDEVTLTVVPHSGYGIKSVKVINQTTSADEVVNYTNDTYTFTMPDSDVEISVEVKQQYQVNTNYIAYPINLADNVSTYYAGEEVTFSIGETLDASYHFDGVKVIDENNQEVSCTFEYGVYTFIMPESNVNIRTAESKMFTITDNSDEHSHLTINNEKTYYVAGETVSFTVSVDNNYEINSVLVEKALEEGYEVIESSLVDGTYSFIVPLSDVRISVETSLKTVTSTDPWTSKTTYTGQYDDYDYEVHIKVVFNGDGTLSWDISYYEWDYEYCDWWGPFSFRNSGGNRAYTYDESTLTVTFTSTSQTSVENEYHLSVTLGSTVPSAVKFKENLGSDSKAQTKDVVLSLA